MMIRSVLLVAAATLLGGCASMEQMSCERQEQSTRGVKPFTTYQLVQPKPGQAAPRALPSGSVPLVPTYTQTFKPGFTKPCTSLTLHKDVVIQRSDDSDVSLTEVREFYAEDGTLITSSNQDLSDQIRRSGTYVATTPLPVPKSAPPGKYKIISKLLYERRGSTRSPILIARTEGFFYIIPPR